MSVVCLSFENSILKKNVIFFWILTSEHLVTKKRRTHARAHSHVPWLRGTYNQPTPSRWPRWRRTLQSNCFPLLRRWRHGRPVPRRRYSTPAPWCCTRWRVLSFPAWMMVRWDSSGCTTRGRRATRNRRKSWFYRICILFFQLPKSFCSIIICVTPASPLSFLKLFYESLYGVIQKGSVFRRRDKGSLEYVPLQSLTWIKRFLEIFFFCYFQS